LSKSKADELVFLPLGGAGEIGMNLNLYGFGPPDRRKWLMVDLGITFGDDSTPGVEVICPDPGYIEDYRKDILALVLTHAHEDHIGAVPYLWDRFRCPIYATPFTAILVTAKLEEAGLLGQAKVRVVPLGGKIEIGPFSVELITLTHSIPEPNALAIRTALGTVLHTGDWKIDPQPLVGEVTDEAALRQLGDEGVLAMVCDSTNVFNAGEAGSEAQVRESLMTLLRGMTGRVAITAFASNFARVETLVEVAHAHGRQVCLVGRAMHKIIGAARETGYLKEGLTFISEQDAALLPRHKVLYACTGSQGEPRAALMRIATGGHPGVKLDAGDTVIFSSRIIPGNERKIFELQNALAVRGIKIVTERDHFVHVSGHPCRDELERMYRWVRPRIAVPVHGEQRHILEHAALAKSLQIPEAPAIGNGDILKLAPGKPVVIDQVPSGRLYLDGTTLIPAGEGSVAERRKLSMAGYINVTLVVEKGKLIADARVAMQGVPVSGMDKDDYADVLAQAAEQAFDDLSRKAREEDEDIEDAVKKSIRRIIRDGHGKKPVTEVTVIRLD